MQKLIASVDSLRAETEKLKSANAGLASSTETVIRNGTRYNNMADAQSKELRRQRQGTQQLGMQFNDLATSISTGASPIQAFNQQLGQIGFAMSEMGGKAGTHNALGFTVQPRQPGAGRGPRRRQPGQLGIDVLERRGHPAPPVRNHGGGPAFPGQRRLPRHVFSFTPAHRQPLRLGNALGGGSSKLPPGFLSGARETQTEDKNTQERQKSSGGGSHKMGENLREQRVDK
jgi:hypothetical protein